MKLSFYESFCVFLCQRQHFFIILHFLIFENCYRNDGLGDGCTILNWDYNHLSSMSYTDAISYTQSHQRPETISCFDYPNYSFHFDQAPGASIVQEVCIIIITYLRGLCRHRAKTISSLFLSLFFTLATLVGFNLWKKLLAYNGCDSSFTW